MPGRHGNRRKSLEHKELRNMREPPAHNLKVSDRFFFGRNRTGKPSKPWKGRAKDSASYTKFQFDRVL
jgi:hypothetical protein